MSGQFPQPRTEVTMLAEIVHHLANLVEEQRRTNALLERIRDQLAVKR